MVNQNYHTVFFQPVRTTYPTFLPQGITTLRPGYIGSQLSGKVNEYLARALGYIQYIIRMIQSSTPFFDKYGSVLQEVPRMYHLVKAFNEIKNEDEGSERNHETEFEQTSYEGPSPRLFI